jgi:hypothetical protein
MNFKFLNKCLAVTAAILAVANVYVHWLGKSAEAQGVDLARVAMQTNGVARPAAKPEAVEATPAKATGKIRWEPLEAEEYPDYMANLRRFGFPEELIRQIVIADVDALYEPRLEVLRTKRVPADAPMQERNRQTTPEDFARMQEWQKLLIEKRERLEALLGGHVPREMIRTPISRNYEAGEYAVSLMPPEKQEAVRQIFENYTLKEESYSVFPNKLREAGFASEMDSYAATHEKRQAELKKILTDEELGKLMVHTMPQGTELQRDMIGMEATEKELADIFKIADDYWYKTGGIYGRWRGRSAPKEDIDRYGVEAEKQVEELLGQERFIDYRMARTDSGRELNNLAARFDVPRETIQQAYLAQKQIDELMRANRGAVASPSLDNEQLIADLNRKMQETLGPAIFEAWVNGKGQRYRIEP